MSQTYFPSGCTCTRAKISSVSLSLSRALSHSHLDQHLLLPHHLDHLPDVRSGLLQLMQFLTKRSNCEPREKHRDARRGQSLVLASSDRARLSLPPSRRPSRAFSRARVRVRAPESSTASSSPTSSVQFVPLRLQTSKILRLVSQRDAQRFDLRVVIRAKTRRRARVDVHGRRHDRRHGSRSPLARTFARSRGAGGTSGRE